MRDKQILSFEKLLSALQEGRKEKKFFVLAIEGEIAAGKSTLARQLQAGLNQKGLRAQIVSMDDYYYPVDQERKAYEGNCDLERIEKEVLIPFAQSGKFKTARFSPALQRLQDYQDYEGDLLILEGNYSLHPFLENYIDLSLFLTVDPALQKKRLEKRNPRIIDRFLTLWIPQSQAYFDHYQIAKKADFILSSSCLEKES